MCTERTINGKTISEIESEISKEFNEEDFQINESDGSKYIPVEAYEKRFNQIFGYLNYDRLVSEAKLICIGSDYSVQVTMTINIYDDDGNPVIKKAANGARPVIIINDTHGVKSYKSDMASAESDAFKQICKSGFGMGSAQIRASSKYKNGGKRSGENFEVLLKTSFQDRRNRLNAKAVKTDTGEEVEVVIFEKNYPEIEKFCPISDFLKRVTTGKCIAFAGRQKTYNNTLQVIFEGNLHAGKAEHAVL